MRRLLVLLAGLWACDRGPAPPAPPAPAAPPAPRLPSSARPPAAALERIAFAREDGLWTVLSDGGDLRRIVPPTVPRASEPTWSPDRRWIAFSAALDPESNLYPRNLFVARPDGSDLRQVTPLPDPGRPLEELPRSLVRGRAVVEAGGVRRPVPGARVTSNDGRRIEATDSDGSFQAYLAVGLHWVKIAGEVDGLPVAASRLIAVLEGRATDLRDVVLASGAQDVPGAPAWTSDGESLVYLLHHGSAADPGEGSARTSLRRIKVDGSGDQMLAIFTRVSLLAGPVVRGTFAWCKASDGQVLKFDLQAKAVAESRPVGIGAPDALAVAPDGGTVATLTLDAAGRRSIVLARGGRMDTVRTFDPGGPVPHALDFSPDGSRLVVELHSPEGRPSLSILSLASGTLAPLVEPASSPVWHGR